MNNKTQSSRMNTSVNDNYRTSPRRDWDNDVIWQIKMLNYRKRIDCNANISTEQTAEEVKVPSLLNGMETSKRKAFYLYDKTRESSETTNLPKESDFEKV